MTRKAGGAGKSGRSGRREGPRLSRPNPPSARSPAATSAAVPAGGRKFRKLRKNFFQLFFLTPLRGPGGFATLVTVSREPGLPKRRGATLFPFGLKGKKE